MMQSTHASITELLSIIRSPVIRMVIRVIFSITSIDKSLEGEAL